MRIISSVKGSAILNLGVRQGDEITITLKNREAIKISQEKPLANKL